MRLEYNINNSGGDWWLTDEHWRALEDAGWNVDWYASSSLPYVVAGDRFLGALAANASVVVASPVEAAARVTEWRTLTGQSPAEQGCECCGRPHYFALVGDDGKYMGDPS